MISVVICIVAFILGCSNYGAILLGIVATISNFSPELTYSALAAFLFTRIKYTDFSLKRWYAPYLYLTTLPVILSWIYPPYIGITVQSILPLLICCLISRVCSDQNSKVSSDLLLGFLIGFFINGCFAISWYFGFQPHISESFWTGQNRFGGFFTDPNAAAISAFLFLVLTGNHPNQKRIPSAFLSVLVALAAGSRSFFLGVGLWFLMMLGAIKKYSILKISLYILIMWVALNSAVWLSPSLHNFLLANLPVGLDRVLSSILIPTMYDYLSNRLIFAQSAFLIFKAAPLTGIGIGQFREIFPYFADSSLGTWTDNANNFYFGLLAEQGILGAIFALGAIFSLRIRGDADKSYKFSLFAFLCLLIVGPHLEFLEVAVLLGMLLGQVVEERYDSPKFLFMSALPAAVISFLIIISNDRGSFQWERDQMGLFRWSSARSVIRVKCSDDIANVTLATQAPQGIDLQMRTSLQAKERFINITPISETFECRGRDSIMITLTCSRTWTPSEILKNTDNRNLGVMLRYQPDYE